MTGPTLQDADGGCHIILPNNRVVAVESQLSRRLVDELLGNASRFIQDHTTTAPNASFDIIKTSQYPWVLQRKQRMNVYLMSYIIATNLLDQWPTF